MSDNGDGFQNFAKKAASPVYFSYGPIFIWLGFSNPAMLRLSLGLGLGLGLGLLGLG